ncbi:MAG: PilN domain-containing protein [Gammaproteobacteria bacterium]|nr:PilN domain-containing protein [Gammaproteobacteria bacterium]
MAHINLLPWREARRKEQQRQFLSLLVFTVVLAGLIMLYVHFQFSGLISYQNQRNEYLQSQIVVLQKRIKDIKELKATKAKLLARMNIIQQLQRSRPEVVHLFDQLVRTLPNGVYLTSVVQKGALLTVQGVAQSNARVSEYMRNLDASKWLGDPRLDVIQTKKVDNNRVSLFTLRVSQRTGKPDTGKGGDQKVAAGGGR